VCWKYSERSTNPVRAYYTQLYDVLTFIVLCYADSETERSHHWCQYLWSGQNSLLVQVNKQGLSVMWNWYDAMINVKLGTCHFPSLCHWARSSPPVDNIWAMMIVQWIRGGKIIRTVLCCIVYDRSVKKSIRPVKNEWWGSGIVICLERGANDVQMVQLMPLPPHYLLLHCFIKIQIGLTFLLLAYQVVW